MAGPILTSSSPPSGPVTGGTTVTLSGSALGAVTSIKFNGILATNLILIDVNTISCVTPPITTGPGFASVQGFGPGNGGVNSNIFQYVTVSDGKSF